jgi:hypothetical protein
MSRGNFKKRQNQMKTYQDLTYNFLYEEYIVKAKTIRNIAKETGLTKKQIQGSIKKFNIQTRREKPSKQLKYQNILTKDFLYEKYIIEAKSINEIEEETGINSGQISKFISIHNIPKRGNSRKGKRNKNLSKYKMDINIGHSYGLLTVIAITDNKLLCQCKCGKIKELHSSRIRNKQVKSCGCLNNRRGIYSPNCKGYGSIPHSIYTKCKVNGSDRNIEFNLTIEDLDTQYQKQKGRCAISGIDIGFHNHKQKHKILSTASLDRIDSTKPYTKDNIQWVHKTIQQMKWNNKQDEFIEWCKIIAKNN